MMRIEQLKNILKAVGLPLAYRVFKTPQTGDFITFVEEKSNNFAADGIAYGSFSEFSVRLCTRQKNPQAELALEAALTAAGIYFEKLEDYIDSENIYQITYEIEV